MSQEKILEVTGRVRPTAQIRILRDFGYIVLGVNGRGAVKALANHPSDPANATTRTSAKGGKVNLKF